MPVFSFLGIELVRTAFESLKPLHNAGAGLVI
jgi:hypothetical protein